MTFLLTWTNSEGQPCQTEFETEDERMVFANVLYVSNYHKRYGKINVKRPTKKQMQSYRDRMRKAFINEQPTD